LLAYLDSLPCFVYIIDIDTNGEVDFSSTQLPFTALAWAAVESVPVFFRIVCRPDRIARIPEERTLGSGASSSSSSPSSPSNRKHRATSAS
jgi:hypothetical protein